MKQVLAFCRPYLERYSGRIALGTGALVLKDLAGAGVPLLIKLAIDALTAGAALSRVAWLTAGIAALSLVKGIFMYWMRVILVGVSRDVEYDMRNDLFAHLVKLDGGFFARYRTGDIMARATNDLNAVRMMLGPALMYLAETSLTLVLALAVMLAVDWQLTLWALAPAPLVSLAVMFFGKRIHDRFEAIQKLYSDISSRVNESLSGIRVIRAYVQEDAEMQRFQELNRLYIGENLRLAKLSGMFLPSLFFFIGLTFLLVLWVGGLRMLDGRITLGSFVMFNSYMGMLVWPMIAFGWVVNLVQRGRASLGRIREMLAEQPRIAAPPAPRPLPESPAPLELDSVSVSFDGRKALEEVSLTIPAGSTIAIVGRTGSGKSTLVHLIPRLLDPSHGSVQYGGADLRELDPAALRRRIAFVPQETFLFSATLADNIAFGAPEAPREAILRAALMAGLEQDLASFPKGLDTEVGERGLTLSGGQKQRVAIARALLRDPSILILDDALSAVDTLTEDRILSSLREFMHGRTTILISHRVSTVRDADRIYVLEDGRIVEQGSHTELLDLNGFYADLYQKQLLEEELESI